MINACKTLQDDRLGGISGIVVELRHQSRARAPQGGLASTLNNEPATKIRCFDRLEVQELLLNIKCAADGAVK